MHALFYKPAGEARAERRKGVVTVLRDARGGARERRKAGEARAVFGVERRKGVVNTKEGRRSPASPEGGPQGSSLT